MQKSEVNQPAKSAHRRVTASTTLNRKYVKRPAARSRIVSDISPLPNSNRKITRFGSPITKKPLQTNVRTERLAKPQVPIKPQVHPTQALANQRMQARKQITQKPQQTKLSAQELKDRAIKRALATTIQQSNDQEAPKIVKPHFGVGRIVLAMTCAVVAVFAIVYFVNLNMPDIQFRAAAAQMSAPYPNYIPHNYAPESISSENNIATLRFRNHSTGETFSINEEKSSWDSNALLNNFVKETYGEDYTVIREQGLTIYISNSDASWVNGGYVYKLSAAKGTLTKRQIGSIATSF